MECGGYMKIIFIMHVYKPKVTSIFVSMNNADY